MNKYQAKAFEMLGMNIFEMGSVYSKRTGKPTSHIAIGGNDSIHISDDGDIHSKEYVLYLRVGKEVVVEARYDGKWTAYENGDHVDPEKVSFRGVVIDLNLDHRPDCIRLSVPNGAVDPLVVPIVWNVITQEEFDRIQNSPETLRRKMEVTFRTGQSLVNIYWKHAKENLVASVRIDLYMEQGGNTRQLMGKYKVTDEVFFKSIEGLAYGKYSFQLFQFDKDGNEIASTDFIGFALEKPREPQAGGRYKMCVHN